MIPMTAVIPRNKRHLLEADWAFTGPPTLPMCLERLLLLDFNLSWPWDSFVSRAYKLVLIRDLS